MKVKTRAEKYNGIILNLLCCALFANLMVFFVFARLPMHASPKLTRSEPRDVSGPSGSSAKSQLRTYESDRYGVSFRYSKDYILTMGQQDLPVYWWLAGIDDGYRSQPDRVMLATVDLPHDAYPGTGFGGAFFNLSVNQKPSAAACYALLPSTERPLNKSVINGVSFVWTTIGGVLNMGHEASEEDYVAYKNGTCYEVTLGMEDMFANAADNAPDLLPLDRSDISRRLRAILFTVKITSRTSEARVPTQTPTPPPERSEPEARQGEHPGLESANKSVHWQRYVNRGLGFSFSYPGTYQRSTSDRQLDENDYRHFLFHVEQPNDPNTNIDVSLIVAMPFFIKYGAGGVKYQRQKIGRHTFYCGLQGSMGSDAGFYDECVFNLNGKTLELSFSPQETEGFGPRTSSAVLLVCLKTFRTFKPTGDN